MAVPAEGFHQATTSCPTTEDDGSLLESHQNIDQHPESSLNQDQSAEKISGELLKVNFGSLLIECHALIDLPELNTYTYTYTKSQLIEMLLNFIHKRS